MVRVGESSKRERLSRMLGAERVKVVVRAGRPSLSRRETQLLRLAIQGLTNNEIASRARLSAGAVKSQLRSAFAKLAHRPIDRPGAGLDPDQPVAVVAPAASPAGEPTVRRG